MSKYTIMPNGFIAKTILTLCLALGWQTTSSLQTYTLSPDAAQEVRNASGAIVPSACVSTFLTGTTTREATYTTSSGTANANPIIAGSDGKFTAFLTPGITYRFRYESTPCSAASPGTTLRNVDGVSAVPVSGQNVDITGTAGEALSLADLVYLSDGSGSLTAGSWYQADADNTYSSTTAVAAGFATAEIASGAEGTIRLAGRMTGLSLSAGEIYYASATAAALATTHPTNARCIGKADRTTTLILPCDAAVLRLPDSDGTHSLVMRTSSDLTADRILTLVPGDAARTLTISGDATLDQNVATTGTPTLSTVTLSGGALIGSADLTIRRNRSEER